MQSGANRSAILFTGTLLTALWASQAEAAIIASSGEATVFNDTFAGNSSAWTNVNVVNGTGTAATTKLAIDSSQLKPSIAGDAGAVVSTKTLAAPLDIANGPISLYMNVRVDTINGGDGSRFSFKLLESTGNRFVDLLIRPGTGSYIEYRNAAGTGVQGSVTGTSGIITSNSTFYTFKFSLSAPDGIASPALAQAFYYNTTSSSYVSLGSIAGLIDLDTGIFNRVEIYNRNGTGGAAYFDEVLVTQVPEPSCALLLGVAATFAGRRRMRDRF